MNKYHIVKQSGNLVYEGAHEVIISAVDWLACIFREIQVDVSI